MGIGRKFETPSILLVDDRPEVRHLLRAILESQSFPCEEAGNGAEALQCLDAQTFALVITDMKMPVMDGFQFLKQVAKKSLAKRPSVIVLTGKQDEAGRRRLSGSHLCRQGGRVAKLVEIADGAARPVDPPLRHHRNRERGLAIQEPDPNSAGAGAAARLPR